ncbi:DUF6893 family small protein [Streptomyces sp. NBC_00075]
MKKIVIVIGGAALAALGALVAGVLPDVRRYLRIRQM